MPNSRVSSPNNEHMTDVHYLGHPDAPPPQTRWAQPAHGRAASPAYVAASATTHSAPNTPGAITLSQGTGTSLMVSWTAPAIDGTHDAAAGFNLQYVPAGTSGWTSVPGVTSPCTLTGLAAGTAINVQLQSFNAAGASVWSATSTLTTAVATPNAPNTPAAATLAQGSGTNLTVTWAAPATDGTHSAASTYNLRSSPAGAGTWTSVSGVTSPCTLSGLTAGAAYDVQIQAANAGGNSGWSATSTLTTAASAYVPNTPAAVTLAQGSGSNLTVTWTAPATDGTHSAATAYSLRSSPSGAGTWTTVSAVTSPYTLTGLTAGAAYDVQIQASDTAGSSAWSATSTLTTAAPVYVPNTPAAATLAQGSGSNLTVTWTAPATDGTHSAATAYSLRSSPSGAGTWTTVSAVTSPYTLTGLTAGAAYDVQIQASDTAGSSAWSATSTLTTAASGPYAPNTPAITSVAPPPNGTNSQLTVTWSAPATDGTHGAATGYNVRTSPSGAGTWTTVTGVTSPYTITGLAGATAIDVEVQATNAAASPSGWSGLTTATTWGATVAPGFWTAAATQTHNASVAPNGGVMMTAVAAPTAVTGTAFAWSTSASTIPTSGLIAAAGDGQTNGWAQYFNAPATAGTYYLWMLAQGSGAVTTGALVTSAITVS